MEETVVAHTLEVPTGETLISFQTPDLRWNGAVLEQKWQIDVHVTGRGIVDRRFEWKRVPQA